MCGGCLPEMPESVESDPMPSMEQVNAAQGDSAPLDRSVISDQDPRRLPGKANTAS